jgi:hypothetical protein
LLSSDLKFVSIEFTCFVTVHMLYMPYKSKKINPYIFPISMFETIDSIDKVSYTVTVHKGR